MSKVTQSYIEARRDGIKWLNSQKRDYNTGVNILSRSGYKGFVAARLARTGEKPQNREKLEYEIRQMIKVWYHPDDPRFEDVDLADDALPGDDGRQETVSEETGQAIVATAEKELAREADEQPAYPPVIAKIIYDFRECYNERARQHRMLAELGETNTQAVCAQRKDIAARIAFLSNRMTLLAAIKSQFEQNRELPSEEQLDELYKKEASPEEKTEKEEGEEEDAEVAKTDLAALSVEELKKAKSNAKSKITKAQNMLLYSTESKPKDGKENPLPDCPKRVKYKKKIEQQKALVEKIEYRLAELQ
ncbi:hypothetical protein [uncultured Bacteroides sp.]|uniref:hypothetical protein n=1 Tax=uncultured Bacteroides sp. TaxID=162156 RepID=UPI00262095ED|nr:hypothetical protein [uncultured Bacteroides sp.]